MLDHLGRIGVDVEHGRNVIDYFEENSVGRAGVVLKDGSKEHADIVIAADGVSGHSWKLLLGREIQARPSGDAIFRASFPVEHAIANPLVAKTFIEGEPKNGRPTIHGYMG